RGDARLHRGAGAGGRVRAGLRRRGDRGGRGGRGHGAGGRNRAPHGGGGAAARASRARPVLGGVRPLGPGGGGDRGRVLSRVPRPTWRGPLGGGRGFGSLCPRAAQGRVGLHGRGGGRGRDGRR